MQTIRGAQGIVTAPHYLASRGPCRSFRMAAMRSGACVAVAATLAVVYPHMTSIGGDGFWVIREGDGRVRHPWLWRRGGKGGSGSLCGP
jgi:gamma-glutamyltranspeptidase/glutathione hydrolase